MYSFLYLSVVMMSFLLVYLLIGHELMVAILLFFILITLLGFTQMKINETKLKKIIQEEMDMIEQPYFDHVDSEGGMAKSQLYKMAKYAMMLHDALEDNTQLESWVQSKITIATEYMSKVKHYLEYEMGLDMIDPEGHDEPEIGGCGEATPMMVDDVESFEIDDEMERLMES